MSKSGSFYDVLGIQWDASEAHIKQAYRKAALKWHPDKNLENKEEAEIMFKRVAEAYEVLSDPQKRSLYDRGGEEGRHGGTDNSWTDNVRFDPFQVFEQFFGGQNPFNLFENAGGNPFGSNSSSGAPFVGGMQSFSSASNSGGTGTFTSSTSSTRVVDGKQITVTETTVRKADGTTETSRSETTSDGSGEDISGRNMFQSSFSTGQEGMQAAFSQQGMMPGMMPWAMQQQGLLPGMMPGMIPWAMPQQGVLPGMMPLTMPWTMPQQGLMPGALPPLMPGMQAMPTGMQQGWWSGASSGQEAQQASQGADAAYAAQVGQMKDMGFTDERASLQALRSANGDLNQAVTCMLGG